MTFDPMTDEEVTDLARDFVTGRVYWPIDEHELRDSFGAMLALAALPPETVEQIANIYEYIDQAGPIAVNGHPMFLSFKMLHKANLDRFQSEVTRMTEALR